MKTEKITCQCGNTYTNTPEENCDEWLVKMPTPNHCPDCSERMKAERLEKLRTENENRIAENLKRIADNIASATPVIFRHTDTTHPRFNAAGWVRVKDWQPTVEKPWLGIVGETGTCKTRVAYLLAAKVIERATKNSAENGWGREIQKNPTFAFVASYEITDLAGKLNATDFKDKHAARDALGKLRRVDVLLIDDIGKGRLSPSVASELFALVNHRYENALPTIWTANTTPEEIAGAMSSDMGAPFAGRLNDSSRILKFK